MEEFSSKLRTPSALISAKTGIMMQQLDVKFREIVATFCGTC